MFESVDRKRLTNLLNILKSNKFADLRNKLRFPNYSFRHIEYTSILKESLIESFIRNKVEFTIELNKIWDFDNIVLESLNKLNNINSILTIYPYIEDSLKVKIFKHIIDNRLDFNNLELLFDCKDINKNIELLNYLNSKNYPIYRKTVIDLSLKDSKYLDYFINSNYSFKVNELDYLVHNTNSSSIMHIYIREYAKDLKHSDYIIDRVDKLIDRNIEFLKRINLSLLRKKILEEFSDSELEIISNSIDIQNYILEGGFKKNLVLYVLKKYNKNNEWLYILDNITLKLPDKINIDYKDLTDSDYESIISIICNTNLLDLNNIKDYKSIIKDKLSLLKNSKEPLDYREYLLLKLFNIDMDNAISLLKEYSEILNSKYLDDLSTENKVYLLILDTINNIVYGDESILESINNMDFSNINPSFMIVYRNKLNNIILDYYNSSLYLNNSDKKIIDGIECNFVAGKNGDKSFKLLISSYSAFVEVGKNIEDYSKDYNRNMIGEQHHRCYFMISNKFLGTPPIRSICLGANYFPNGSLFACAPYDINSFGINDAYSVLTGKNNLFLLPDDLIDYTRYLYSELDFELRDLTGKFIKKQPDYLAFICDDFNNLTVFEKKIFELTKKASISFSKYSGKSIPINIVEKNKIIKNQSIILKSKLKSLFDINSKYYLDSNLVKEIVNDYETIYCGLYYSKSKYKDLFKETSLEESYSYIIYSELIKINNNKSKLCLKALLDALRLENKKYSLVDIENKIEPSFPLNDLICRLYNDLGIDDEDEEENEYFNNLINCNNDSLTYETYYKKYIINEYNNDDFMLNKELLEPILLKNKDLIIESVNYIENNNINKKSTYHNQEHIKNVTLFSILISDLENIDPYYKNIIILASIYHDSGRHNDYSLDHAIESAKYFKNNYDNTITNYSEYELGIISSLIAFHEVDRKLPVEESKLILLNFIKKYTGLKEINDLDKIYKCAEIIRDSDALDRTRFTGIGKDMLSPKYLYYKSSKSLVKFSCAIRDRFYINRIINLGGEESIINELLNYYDSQKLLDLVNRESSNYPELDINKYLKFLLKNIKGKQNEKK